MEPNAVTPGNPAVEPAEPVVEPVVEPGGPGVVVPPNQEPQPRLFAGKYKTVEELEEGYKNSDKEAIRMAQEIRRLSTLATGARTPKPEVATPAKVGYEGFFDKETEDALVKMITHFFRNNITEYSQSQKSHETYKSQVAEIWEETKKEFPDVANADSELYKLANQILFDRGLATLQENGDLVLVTPYAYRIAVEAAAATLAKQAPEKVAQGVKKSQATSVSGRAVGFTPQGKLTPEQYEKLSDDDKDKYDAWQLSQKK